MTREHTISAAESLPLGHEGQCAARQVVSAECVLESGMCRARVDEICEPELSDISEALKNLRVDKA